MQPTTLDTHWHTYGHHHMTRDQHAKEKAHEQVELTHQHPLGPFHDSSPLTSLALAGHRMRSSGSPRRRATSSTGLGTGTALLPRPLGFPGWDTTAAT
jgi:hypothetical protein